jgi:hypothetical protein
MIWLWILLLIGSTLGRNRQFTHSFPNEAAAKAYAAKHGLTFHSRIFPDKNDYIFEIENAQFRGTIPTELVEQHEVKRSHRYTPPTDPKKHMQWNYDGISPWVTTLYDAHLNLTAAHMQNVTGKGILVAIVDDGVDYRHHDFGNRYVKGVNIVGHTSDPLPTDRRDTHGTSVAGLILAGWNDDTCGYGIAPEASFAAIKVLDRMLGLTDPLEAQAESAWAFSDQYIDLYSNSWGPIDSGDYLGEVGHFTLQAISSVATSGRKGLGANYFWAAGNGGQVKDSANFDGFCNSRYVNCIGAMGYEGRIVDYSEECACLLAVTPSSDFNGVRGRGIFSSDGNLPNHNECTNGFGGTSASAPQAAGIGALMLHANPRLSRRDVTKIIIVSSNERLKQNALEGKEHANLEWTQNGAGYLHHNKAGFGQMDAGRAVALAKNWVNLPAEQEYKVAFLLNDGIRTIEPSSRGIFAVTINVIPSLGVHNLEWVILYVDLDFRGCFMNNVKKISIFSPYGTESVMMSENIHLTRQSLTWKFSSIKHYGEQPSGQWRVEIENAERGAVYVKSLELHMYGHEQQY